MEFEEKILKLIRFLKEKGVWGEFMNQWTNYRNTDEYNVECYGTQFSESVNKCDYADYLLLWYLDSSFPWWHDNHYGMQYTKRWASICLDYLSLLNKEYASNKHYKEFVEVIEKLNNRRI